MNHDRTEWCYGCERWYLFGTKCVCILENLKPSKRNPILEKTLQEVSQKKLEEASLLFEEKKEIGVKHDNGKMRFSLLPMNVLAEIVKVLELGSKKYADFNWQHVDNARERYYNAALRHLFAWWDGERLDPETGENHLAHALCNIIFLLWFDLKENKK